MSDQNNFYICGMDSSILQKKHLKTNQMSNCLEKACDKKESNNYININTNFKKTNGQKIKKKDLLHCLKWLEANDYEAIVKYCDNMRNIDFDFSINFLNLFSNITENQLNYFIARLYQETESFIFKNSFVSLICTEYCLRKLRYGFLKQFKTFIQFADKKIDMPHYYIMKKFENKFIDSSIEEMQSKINDKNYSLKSNSENILNRNSLLDLIMPWQMKYFLSHGDKQNNISKCFIACVEKQYNKLAILFCQDPKINVNCFQCIALDISINKGNLPLIRYFVEKTNMRVFRKNSRCVEQASSRNKLEIFSYLLSNKKIAKESKYKNKNRKYYNNYVDFIIEKRIEFLKPLFDNAIPILESEIEYIIRTQPKEIRFQLYNMLYNHYPEQIFNVLKSVRLPIDFFTNSNFLVETNFHVAFNNGELFKFYKDNNMQKHLSLILNRFLEPIVQINNGSLPIYVLYFILEHFDFISQLNRKFVISHIVFMRKKIYQKELNVSTEGAHNENSYRTNSKPDTKLILAEQSLRDCNFDNIAPMPQTQNIQIDSQRSFERSSARSLAVGHCASKVDISNCKDSNIQSNQKLYIRFTTNINKSKKRKLEDVYQYDITESIMHNKKHLKYQDDNYNVSDITENQNINFFKNTKEQSSKDSDQDA